MNVSVIGQIAVAGAAVVAAWFAYRSSNRATAVSEKKVDQEAYDRAIVFYQRQIDDAQKQADRLTGQIDRMTAQLERVNRELEREQESSATLRSQLKAMQQTVTLFEDTIAELKAKLAQRMDAQGSGTAA